MRALRDAYDLETIDLSRALPYTTYLGHLVATLQHRQLFRTINGRFGFGLEAVKPGDTLCIFDGAPSAHAVRRMAGSNEDLYSLVSETYVHDVMNGEVENLGLQRQDFTLA